MEKSLKQGRYGSSPHSSIFWIVALREGRRLFTVCSQVAHLIEHPLPDLLPQSGFRHYVDLVVEPFFEELAEADEVKQVSAIVEVDQDVDVTFLPLFATDHRTEYADFMDLEAGGQLRFGPVQDFKNSFDARHEQLLPKLQQ